MRDCRGTDPALRDYGREPFVVNIDRLTKQNPNFRTTLWTGEHLQVTLMRIPAGGDIGLERHPGVDQFLRIESGNALVRMGSSKNNLWYQKKAGSNDAILVPAGIWHNVMNIGNDPLLVYSIYATPQHPFGTVHATKELAEAAEKH